MGGFYTDVTELHNTQTKMTPSTESLLLMIILDQKIPNEDIRDKSKADILAKMLVCIQALWIVFQAFEREVTGYPLALLEVHTIVHVVCALTTYAFCFRKPLSINSPTYIPIRNFDYSIGVTHREEYRKTFRMLMAFILQMTCNRYGRITKGFCRYTKCKTTDAEPQFVWDVACIKSSKENPQHISGATEAGSEGIGQGSKRICKSYHCYLPDLQRFFVYLEIFLRGHSITNHKTMLKRVTAISWT